MQVIETMDEYFRFLGADRSYSIDDYQCELCGGEDFEVVRNFIDGGGNVLVPIKVKSCRNCGYMMQHPKFERDYYKEFYRLYYNLARARSGRQDQVKFVDEKGGSTNLYLENAEKRGRLLKNYMRSRLPEDGVLLDVGCGCGGFLVPFRQDGWQVHGNDPDSAHIDEGNKHWGLGLVNVEAEEMEYEPETFDLIIIMGSLEHVYDPNIVLNKCWRFLKENGQIVIEGRFFPIGPSYRYLNANHHRYLREQSCQLMLIKHGFLPYEVTTHTVTGSDTGRDGDGFVFARKTTDNKQEMLRDALANKSLVETPNEVRYKLELHDFLLAQTQL